jgi:hypothetical protein
VCIKNWEREYNIIRIDQNKSDWYFNAISLTEFSPIELFSTAHQIALFHTPVVTFCILILLKEKKRRTRPAVNCDTFLKS